MAQNEIVIREKNDCLKYETHSNSVQLSLCWRTLVFFSAHASEHEFVSSIHSAA
jgi:hypothetical protein